MQVSDASVTQMPEYLQRVQVLKNTGFIDDEKVVQMKGRIMCELNSCDELVGSEMIFAGVLAELEPEEAVALLSALVFQVRVSSLPLPHSLRVCVCSR
jgi:antiviral helicase SKI2